VSAPRQGRADRGAAAADLAPGLAGAAPAANRWARLTWQAGDPRSLAAALAARLGVVAEDSDDGTWRIDLGGEPLDVVPWRREGPRDMPSPEGRLMLEPIDGGGPVPEPVDGARLSLAGIAWCTVELDRAEAELEPWLLPADRAMGDGDGPVDPHLGARTRRRRTAVLPGRAIVFAEPSTEGRLAASLARDDEGPCALYIAPSAGLAAWVAEARRRAVTVSARRPGPLGEAAILPGRVMAGPHLLMVEAVAMPASPGTINP
jgi:hypothetical protein